MVKYDLILSDEMMETVQSEFELQMFASEVRNDKILHESIQMLCFDTLAPGTGGGGLFPFLLQVKRPNNHISN